MGPARNERLGGGAGAALALVMVAGAVNYVDRVTLSVAAPLISAELHLKAGAMGVLLSAFLWTYAVAQWPAGALVDRLGPRRLLGGALALWSAAQAATGLAAGLPQLIAARMCLGLGEAPIVVGLTAGAACTGLALAAPAGAAGGALALAAICGALFSANVATAAIWALAVAAAPARFTATVGAVQNFGGLVGGALAPIVTGLTVERAHGFAPALAITAAAGLAGAMIYLLGVRAPIDDRLPDSRNATATGN
jgi:MFS family permease